MILECFWILLGGDFLIKTITVRLDEELYKSFKIKMVLDNNTMQDRIVEFISDDVKVFESNNKFMDKGKK